MTPRILKVIEESKAARAREEKKAAAFFAVRHGSSRTTFLIGPLAIKVPSLRTLKNLVLHPKSGGIKKRTLLWRAVVANLTERATWDMTRASFLAPTYLTLGGFVNVAKRVHGSPASDDTIRVRLRLFGLEDRPAELDINGHSMYPDGDWLYTGDGYVLVDYGDMHASGKPLSGYIVENLEALNRALGPAQNTPD